MSDSDKHTNSDKQENGGPTNPEPCVDCGRANVPTGRNRYGEGPRCASCWSRRADRMD